MARRDFRPRNNLILVYFYFGKNLSALPGTVILISPGKEISPVRIDMSSALVSVDHEGDNEDDDDNDEEEDSEDDDGDNDDDE